MDTKWFITLILTVLLTCAAFVALPLCSTGITVTDDLVGDTHWTIDDSPVIIEDSFTIPAGTTLQIDDGVQVYVDGAYTIYVNGSLKINGTTASPVVITSNAGVPAAGDWNGFIFNQSSGAQIVNAEISYADRPMIVNGTRNMTIYNTVFANSLSEDVNMTYNSSATFINCSYSAANATDGILHWGNWLMVQAVFEGNSTPIEGVDVMVTDNDSPLYASSKYVGTDPKTNATGWIGPVPAIATTYDHSNLSTINITKVYSKYEYSMSSSYGLKNKKLENVDVMTNNAVQLVFDITGPAPVTNFQANVLSGTEINLSWTPPADADFKNVVLFEADDLGYYQQIDTVDEMFVVLTGLEDKTTYNFSIMCMDNEITPNPSGPVYVNATTWDLTAPTSPFNVTAKNISGRAITVQWDANTEDDLDGYYVFSSNPDTTGWNPAVTVDVTTTEHEFTGLVSETEYNFYVEAFDDWPTPNNSTRSDILTVTTLDITAPGVPNINLPNSTTLTFLNIRGQLMDKESLLIVIHSDTRGYFNTTTGTGGIINQTIPLTNGDNVVNIHARDAANNEGDKFTHTIFCDSEAPVATAQENLDIEEGDEVVFDANGSTDNFGIVEYTWAFIYGNATKTLTGESVNFTFDNVHNHLVTLTVEDNLGNTGVTTFWVNVTEKYIEPVDDVLPKVDDHKPADQAYDINVSVAIEVEFSELVNPLNTVISLYQGTSVIDGSSVVSTDSLSAKFTATGKLTYNTTYRVNVTFRQVHRHRETNVQHHLPGERHHGGPGREREFVGVDLYNRGEPVHRHHPNG